MSGGFTPTLRRTDVSVSGKASFLASEQIRVKRGGITLDASLVSADDNGDKIVEEGTFVSEVTATGKYGPYSDTGPLTNEVQTVTITGEPTGGTFTLTYGGDTTAGIAYNATGPAVLAALAALDTLDDDDITVTRSGWEYTVTFVGDEGGQDVQALTADESGLTGGTTPDVVVATATAGGTEVNDGREDPSDDTSGYLLESVNLRNGDVICGLLIEGSVLEARVIPTPDATIRGAVKGRIQFQ